MLPEETLRAEGWLPVADNPPAYDLATHYIVVEGYEVLSDRVQRNHKIKPWDTRGQLVDTQMAASIEREAPHFYKWWEHVTYVDFMRRAWLMWETILGGGLAATIVITVEKFIEFIITQFGKKKSTTETALRAILRERIRYLCKIHINAGHISYSDREDLIDMYKVYRDSLDGNGNLEPEMNEVMKLRCC